MITLARTIPTKGIVPTQKVIIPGGRVTFRVCRVVRTIHLMCEIFRDHDQKLLVQGYSRVAILT